VGSLATSLVVSLAALAGAAGEAPSTAPAATDGRVLAAGSYHTCAVDPAGTVTCWGHGVRGQLGNGAAADAAVRVPGPIQDRGGEHDSTQGTS